MEIKTIAIATTWALGGVLLAPALAAPRTYTVRPESRITVHVGKGGLFKFAGHEHEVEGRAKGGEIVADDADLTRSSVNVVWDARGLIVRLTKDEPAEDVPKVQAKMLGPDVLDVARYPEVTFRSVAVEGKPAGDEQWDLTLSGDLTIHGVTRRVSLPVHVTRKTDTLRTTGGLTIRHTDFGLKPISVAGVVKVKNELKLDFDIIADAP
jgi:polyisoprenoid-binding protein YceI